MISLQEHYNNEKQLERTIIGLLNKDNEADVIDFLWSKNMVFGVYEISKNNIEAAKQYFYTCGRLDEVRVSKYNSRIFDYGLKNVSLMLLSDSSDLIERYSNLRYKGDGKNYPDMDTLVAQGEISIWCHSIFMVVKEEWDLLKRNLDLIENKTLRSTSSSAQLMRLDYEFLKAIYERNKEKMEIVLSELTSPDIHKRRNEDPLLRKYISIPAIGYAKLAYLKGFEINVISPLVPKELLVVKPLPNYGESYDFLRKDTN
jgi:hypothetical protein